MPVAGSKGLKAQEFLDFVQQPENRGRFFELERGEIIELPTSGRYHAFVCGNIAGILDGYCVGQRRGYVCSNGAGVIVEEDPDTVSGPDLSYFDDVESAADVERGYAATPPLLAVEVLSPHDRLTRMSVRVAQMLARGVQLVWVVDAEAHEVCIYRRGRDPYIATAEKELTGEDVLPNFACRVSEFFALPGRASA
jgi:Uma2 family endonuclease